VCSSHYVAVAWQGCNGRDSAPPEVVAAHGQLLMHYCPPPNGGVSRSDSGEDTHAGIAVYAARLAKSQSTPQEISGPPTSFERIYHEIVRCHSEPACDLFWARAEDAATASDVSCEQPRKHVSPILPREACWTDGTRSSCRKSAVLGEKHIDMLLERIEKVCGELGRLCGQDGKCIAAAAPMLSHDALLGSELWHGDMLCLHQDVCRRMRAQETAMEVESQELRTCLDALSTECGAKREKAIEVAGVCASEEGSLAAMESKLAQILSELRHAQRASTEQLVARQRLQRELALCVGVFSGELSVQRGIGRGLEEERASLRDQAVELGRELQKRSFQADELVSTNLDTCADIATLRAQQLWAEGFAKLNGGSLMDEMVALCEELRVARVARDTAGEQVCCAEGAEEEVVVEEEEQDGEEDEPEVAAKEAKFVNGDNQNYMRKKEKQESKDPMNQNDSRFEAISPEDALSPAPVPQLNPGLPRSLEDVCSSLRKDLLMSEEAHDLLRDCVAQISRRAEEMEATMNADLERRELLEEVETKEQELLALQCAAQRLSENTYVPGPDPPDEIDMVVSNAFERLGLGIAPPLARLGTTQRYLFQLTELDARIVDGPVEGEDRVRFRMRELPEFEGGVAGNSDGISEREGESDESEWLTAGQLVDVAGISAFLDSDVEEEPLSPPMVSKDIANCSQDTDGTPAPLESTELQSPGEVPRKRAEPQRDAQPLWTRLRRVASALRATSSGTPPPAVAWFAQPCDGMHSRHASNMGGGNSSSHAAHSQRPASSPKKRAAPGASSTTANIDAIVRPLRNGLARNCGTSGSPQNSGSLSHCISSSSRNFTGGNTAAAYAAGFAAASAAAPHIAAVLGERRNAGQMGAVRKGAGTPTTPPRTYTPPRVYISRDLSPPLFQPAFR